VGLQPHNFVGEEHCLEEAIVDDIYGNRPTSTQPVQRATHFTQGAASSFVVDENSYFGHVEVGGSSIELTMNTLYSMFKGLESKLQVGLDRSEGQEITFHDWDFPSEILSLINSIHL